MTTHGNDPEKDTISNPLRNNLIEDSKDLDSNPIKNVRSSSMFTCFANMICTICGAGILGLPYAFSLSGWVSGTMFLAIAGLMNASACHLLSLCAAKIGPPSSLYSVMEPVGKNLTLFVDIMMCINLFGTAVAYLVVIGGTMPDACEQMGATGIWVDRSTWVLVGWILVTPISIPHNIDFIGNASSTGLFVLIFLTFVVFLYALPPDQTGVSSCDDATKEDDLPCQGDTTMGDGLTALSVLQSLSIFIFGYASQITTFPICNELKNINQSKLDFIFVSSSMMSTCLYIIVAVCGYLTFGDSVESNILLNYPTEALVSAVRISISLVVCSSYALNLNPARRCLMTVFQNYFDDTKGIKASQSTIRFRYYGITAVFLGASLGIALTVDDLGVVISFVGATGATLLMFVLPGGLFLYHFPLDCGYYVDLPINYLKDMGEYNVKSALLAPEERTSTHNYDIDDSYIANDDVDDIKQQIIGRTTTTNTTETDISTLTPSTSDPEFRATMRTSSRTRSRGGKVLEVRINDMPTPRPTLWTRRLAWVQFIIGLVLTPLCLTLLFLPEA